MQILIVVTTSDDRHRQCSWNTDRITKRDTDAVASYVLEIMKDAKRDGAEVNEVFVFTGGVWTRHVGRGEIYALVYGS